jgi:Domain of unknown function (DUF5753)
MTHQMLPLHPGAHARLDGPFIIVGFPDVNDPDMVYLEYTAKDQYLEDANSTKRYEVLFEYIHTTSCEVDWPTGWAGSGHKWATRSGIEAWRLSCCPS